MGPSEGWVDASALKRSWSRSELGVSEFLRVFSSARAALEAPKAAFGAAPACETLAPRYTTTNDPQLVADRNASQVHRLSLIHI